MNLRQSKHVACRHYCICSDLQASLLRPTKGSANLRRQNWGICNLQHLLAYHKVAWGMILLLCLESVVHCVAEALDGHLDVVLLAGPWIERRPMQTVVPELKEGRNDDTQIIQWIGKAKQPS